MLTLDERRTLQALEQLDWGCTLLTNDVTVAFRLLADGFAARDEAGLETQWNITDAGRRELDRLREKEREGGE